MSNKKLKIVADSNIPYLKGVLEPFAEVIYKKGDQISAQDLENTSALIVRTRTKCNEKLLENANKLEIILTATIGFDHIDINYCSSRNIQVVTAAGCNARGVLQWVGANLALDAKNRGWTPEQKTIGVVGIGNVGSKVAEYAKKWGFNTLCCDPFKDNADFVDISYIYRYSDIITFHVPMTYGGEYPTYHLLSGQNIKHGSLILNASRGEVLDTQKVKTLDCHFAIDTWENEPNLDLEMLEKSFVATAHIAGYSSQGKANGTAMVVKALSEKYDLGLDNWYPQGVNPSLAKDISWAEMCNAMPKYYDIAKESEILRKDVSRFEEIRNNYNLREEFF